MGCIHIYCGDGKGKTTAAAGLAVRMAGSGGQALVVRFMKTDNSGEVKGLEQVKGIRIFPCERSFGFTWQMTKDQKREAAVYYTEIFKTAAGELKKAAETGPVLLVLDELCAAVNNGFVQEKPVLDFLDEIREKGWQEPAEVVITGRDPSKNLMDRADYISEVRKIRHPFDRGMSARRGIEY